MNHCSTGPEDGNKGPGIWCRDDRNMDESRCRRVTEVKTGLVEKVDDKEKLTRPEVATDP